METKVIDYTDDKLIAVLHNDNSRFLTVEKDGKLMEVDIVELARMDAEEILSFLGRDLKTLILSQEDNPRFVNDYAMARLIIAVKSALKTAEHLISLLHEKGKECDADKGCDEDSKDNQK